MLEHEVRRAIAGMRQSIAEVEALRSTMRRSHRRAEWLLGLLVLIWAANTGLAILVPHPLPVPWFTLLSVTGVTFAVAMEAHTLGVTSTSIRNVTNDLQWMRRSLEQCERDAADRGVVFDD